MNTDVGSAEIDAVLAYNKMLKKKEAEDAYWDGMRNRNRGVDAGNTAQRKQRKQHKQPATAAPVSAAQAARQEDQLQRRPGTAAGGGGATAGSVSGGGGQKPKNSLTKVQMARKDKNKAARANHRRKANATKKNKQ